MDNNIVTITAWRPEDEPWHPNYKKNSPNLFNEAQGSLKTLRDVLRFAVSRFNEAGLFFGHGSDNAHDEAAYLILHTLHLPLDTLEPYLDAVLLNDERNQLLELIRRRVEERVPVAYLTHQAWQG